MLLLPAVVCEMVLPVLVLVLPVLVFIVIDTTPRRVLLLLVVVFL